MKKYTSAPLPFQGQKRRFVHQLEELAVRLGGGGGATFVDLFGGSGLVSHGLKYTCPHCRVVYNDYNHYGERLANVGRTNEMLRALRPIVSGVTRTRRIDEPVRSQVVAEVERWAKSGYVDWFSLSSNLLFVMNYAHSLEELVGQTLYNRIRQDDYNVEGYLEGVEVVSMDYRQLFDQFRLASDVVFVLDPPYLSTDCGTYKSDGYWRLTDYLDVLKCLQGTRFVYFTSSKSAIIELADWMGRNQAIGNPFDGANVHRLHVGGVALNYDDIMLVKAV